jgi:hypothetical protein
MTPEFMTTFKPRKIVVQPEQSVEITELQILSAHDIWVPSPRLVVTLRGGIQINITGPEYRALGDWTNETLEQFLIEKLGLEPA